MQAILKLFWWNVSIGCKPGSEDSQIGTWKKYRRIHVDSFTNPKAQYYHIIPPSNAVSCPEMNWNHQKKMQERKEEKQRKKNGKVQKRNKTVFQMWFYQSFNINIKRLSLPCPNSGGDPRITIWKEIQPLYSHSIPFRHCWRRLSRITTTEHPATVIYFIRNVVVRLMIFVNFYVVEHADAFLFHILRRDEYGNNKQQL